jgi:iron complex transport system ATP-binding protein
MSMSFNVNHISFHYPHQPVVFNDVCVSLEPGEICVILGPNGAGKSTLLNCLGGYLTPDSGEILLDAQDVTRMKPAHRARRIGLVAQSADTSSDLDVQDYLALGHAARLGFCAVPGEEEYRKVDEVMDELEIGHMRRRSLSCLSGGERQQVEIARVLVQDTDIILMDEPTSHLDYGNQLKVLRMVRRLCCEHKKTVLLTTHIPDHALLLGQKTAIMDGHGQLTVGAVAEVLTEERLQQVYRADIRILWIDELERLACVPGMVEDPVLPSDEVERGRRGG